MLYQKRDLATSQDVGDPGPLPADLVGFADATLADLEADLPAGRAAEMGYAGVGFFPVGAAEPAATRKIPPLVFMQRLAAATRIAIRAAGRTDPVIEDFLDLLRTADLVDLDHADTVLGVGYMVDQELLTPEQAAQLLS